MWFYDLRQWTTLKDYGKLNEVLRIMSLGGP